MENESTTSHRQDAGQDSKNVARSRTAKQRGELAELAFMYKAADLGFGVAKPYGDSERYDFILSRGGRIWRVQVKSTACVHRRGYKVTAHRNSKRAQVPYTSKEIDILVAYIVPREVWYVIPVEAIQGSRTLYLSPGGTGESVARYEKFREAWHLMTPAADASPADAGLGKDALEYPSCQEHAVKPGFTHAVCLLLALGAGDTATVKITPAQLDFGRQPVGKASSPQTVTLTNTGTVSLTITDIIPSGIDFHETNNCGATLPPGADCTIEITFTPATTGPRLGTLVILDSVPGSPSRVALTGIGE